MKNPFEALRAAERPILQLSGGKDSIATLFRIKEFWPKLEILTCDTGDMFPEMNDILEKVQALCTEETGLRFTRFITDVEAVREDRGWPSDIIPQKLHTEFAPANPEPGCPRLQFTLECCSLSMYVPMHAYMVDQECDLIVRGTKFSDPTRLDMEADIYGIPTCYPLADFDDNMVFAYLTYLQNDVTKAVLSLYKEAEIERGLDCMHCTGWLTEHKAKFRYMARKHPETLRIVQNRLQRMHGHILEAGISFFEALDVTEEVQ